MRIVIDMNLPPGWEAIFEEGGFDAVHWSAVGDADAPDRRIMQWARQREYVVLTHDLDFSALLASTQAAAPSVVQLRTDDILPSDKSDLVVRAFRQFEAELREGVILSIDVEHSRVRYLPLGE